MIIIIPARIGSKGIPRKVLRPFRGRPLISCAIEAALSVQNASVYVNTDSKDISDFVEKNYPNVLIYERDASLSSDLITLDEVCFDFVCKNDFDDENVLITIQPTSPFITPDIIESVAAKLLTGKSGSVVTVTEKKKLTWKKTGDVFKPAYKERRNRQELEPIYEENGAVLGCFIDELRKTETRLNEPVYCVPVSDGQSDEFVDRLNDLIPMGRMANPNEYVGAIQFLCSDASAYMNGQNIVIDGGRSVI